MDTCRRGPSGCPGWLIVTACGRHARDAGNPARDRRLPRRGTPGSAGQAAAADTEAAALLLMGAVHHLLLEYVIRQTTQLSSGRVVRQVNEVRPTT